MMFMKNHGIFLLVLLALCMCASPAFASHIECVVNETQVMFEAHTPYSYAFSGGHFTAVFNSSQAGVPQILHNISVIVGSSNGDYPANITIVLQNAEGNLNLTDAFTSVAVMGQQNEWTSYGDFNYVLEPNTNYTVSLDSVLEYSYIGVVGLSDYGIAFQLIGNDQICTLVMGHTESLLTDVGAGTGMFIASVQDPLVGLLLGLGIIGGVLSIFMAIAYVVKVAVTR